MITQHLNSGVEMGGGQPPNEGSQMGLCVSLTTRALMLPPFPTVSATEGNWIPVDLHGCSFFNIASLPTW